MYHVGIIVADLVEAQRRFTALLGVLWGPTMDVVAPFTFADGNVMDVNLRYVHSTEPTHLELIEEVPGTPWERNEHSNLHHIGYFADDVDAESRRLAAIGCPFNLGARPDPSAPLNFAYHVDPLGVRLEFVSESRRRPMEEIYFKPVSPQP
jgi:catechol 2,3-dioxygenase-like lactoylglutathione lyase family enzyme